MEPFIINDRPKLCCSVVNIDLGQKKNLRTTQLRVVQFRFAFSEQRKVLEDAFEAADKNGDGVLSGSKTILHSSLTSGGQML
jgi:hypothetical protein